MLNQHDVVPYLLSCELITPQSVIDGNVAVLDSSRRNRNYKIISPDGLYLVKHAVGAHRIASLAHEAAAYQQIFSGGRSNGIAGHLPRFHAYDPEQHILILELVQDAENLREQQQRLGRVPSRSSQKIARALAALHRTTLTDPVSTARASALSLHRPGLTWIRAASRGSVELVEIIQKQKSFTNDLDHLSHEWQPSGFIHGDVRAENFLIPVPLRRNDRPLKIVDLEFAGAGDPAWDVGCMLGEYLQFWLFSIPSMTANSLDHFLNLAECPLETIQPTFSAFWTQYTKCMRLSGSESDEFLLRAIKFSALRLIVSAFEMSVALSSLTACVLSLVQVGMNILVQPEKAAIELFGIALCHD